MTIIHQTTVGSSARSRNCGIKHARASLILFLDADIVTENNVIAQHLQMHQQYDDLHTVILGQVASPKEWQTTALDEVCNTSQEWDDINIGKVSWDHFFTGHISTHKQFLESVGGFDENYLRCEDIELGSRLGTQGMQLYYLANAVGYHYHQRSVSQELRNNKIYAQMFAYFYQHGSPEMQAHVKESWFMENNPRVQIKRLLGVILANPVSQKISLILADKLSQNIPKISQFIWRIVFFYIGYQSFQQTLKQDKTDTELPKHPDHKNT